MAKYNLRKRPTSMELNDSNLDKSNKEKNSVSKDNKAQEKKRKKKLDQVVREAEVTDVTDDKQTNPATPHSVLSDNAEFDDHIQVSGAEPYLTASAFSNFVLVVQGHRLHVNKGYLSVYSSLFDVMFNSNVLEGNQMETELTEISVNEFLLLLIAIYPSKKQGMVDEANVDSLLKMAARFEVSDVLKRCEVFLKHAVEIPISKKLLLSEQYNLERLQKWCVRQFQTMDSLRKLKAEPEFEHLSSMVKAMIIENIADQADNVSQKSPARNDLVRNVRMSTTPKR
ncbi:BTB/POZ domain-containing protein [Ditylenchus destructor]|nr:BTB/POZ domain-containing protein [Ditylenchus destructor]